MGRMTVAQLAEQVEALTAVIAAQNGAPVETQATQETQAKVETIAPSMFLRDASDKRTCSPVFEPSAQETYIRLVPVDKDGALKHQKANPEKLAGVRIGASALAALIADERFVSEVNKAARHPMSVEVPSA